MKRYSFLIILILFGFLVANSQQTNYLEYHKACRKAETFFLDNDTVNSIETYREVFNSFEILFPRDCFMAAQIAHKLGNDSMAVEFILKAIPFGLRHQFFSVYDSTYYLDYKIRELTKTKYWNKIIEQEDSLRKIYLNRVDWQLKSEIAGLFSEDQKLRRRCNIWFNMVFRPGLEKRFKRLNRSHMRYLDSVFQVHGYPGVWLTGIKDTLNSESKGVHNNANLSEIVSIILYHNDSVYLNYGEFLYKELQIGHIDPRTYAMIRDFNDRHLVKSDKKEKMYYNTWWQRDNFTKEEFEMHCNQIGCPTKQHLRALNQKIGKGYDIFWWPFR